jgi:hypothetical protein
MKMTPPKRFAVRSALVTGTTLATIIGAQALASYDAASFSKTPPAVIQPQFAGSIQSYTEVPAVAPNIVILRHAGQTTQQGSPSIVNPQVAVIQPPNPVQVAAPQPVPQQIAPVVAQTRSSR